MLTYSFEHLDGIPLYEHLYHCIRQDIETGALKPGEKLPSKRALAHHLGISTITVEGAYGQLVAEGYCTSQPKRGYYVTAALPAKLGVRSQSAGGFPSETTQCKLLKVSEGKSPPSQSDNIAREVTQFPMGGEGFGESRGGEAQGAESGVDGGGGVWIFSGVLGVFPRRDAGCVSQCNRGVRASVL